MVDGYDTLMIAFIAPLLAQHWGLTHPQIGGVFANYLHPVALKEEKTRNPAVKETDAWGFVPPPLIGHTDKASSWASSLSNLNQGFLTYSIRPTLVRMEQAMAKKLLSPSERKEIDIRFNFKGLLRGDFAEQSAGYVHALQNGWMSIDEVRDLEDFPPLPDGKGGEYRAPLNMAPVGMPVEKP